MAKSRFEIIRYEPDFADELDALNRYTLTPDTEINRLYREWKYEHNPYLPDPQIYVVRDKGRIVGASGAFGARWQVGKDPQKIFDCPCVADLVIAPKYRKRGLFTRIMKEMARGVSASGFHYLSCLSGVPLVVYASHALGWRGIGPLHMTEREGRGLLIRKLKDVAKRHPPLVNLYRCLKGSLPSNDLPTTPSAESAESVPFAQMFASLDQAAADGRVPDSVAVEAAPRLTAMADLVQRLGTDGRIRHVRDETYFNWRFGNPMREYRFLYIGTSRLEGYLVLSAPRFQSSRPDVAVADWEGTSLEVKRVLLQAAFESGDFPIARAWMIGFDDESKELLCGAGFEPQIKTENGLDGIEQTVLVKALSDRPTREWAIANRSLLNPESWGLRMIYSDEF